MNKRITLISLLVLLAVIFAGCGFENDVEEVETFLDHHDDDEAEILEQIKRELGINIDDTELPLNFYLLQSIRDFLFSFKRGLLVDMVYGIRFTNQKPEKYSQSTASAHTRVRVIQYYTKFPSGRQQAHEIAHQVWRWLKGEKADRVRSIFAYLYSISDPDDYISPYAAKERDKLQWIKEDFCETFAAVAVYSWRMPFAGQFPDLRSFFDRPVLLAKILTVMELFEESEGEFQILATFRGGRNQMHTNVHFYRVERDQEDQEGRIESIRFPLGLVRFGYPVLFKGLADITRSVLAGYPGYPLVPQDVPTDVEVAIDPTDIVDRENEVIFD